MYFNYMKINIIKKEALFLTVNQRGSDSSRPEGSDKNQVVTY